MKWGLSEKIASLFSLFIFVSVVIFSLLITNLLKSSLLNQKKQDVQKAAQTIAAVIAADISLYKDEFSPNGHIFDKWEFEAISRILKNQEIPYFISYAIYIKPRDAKANPLIIDTNDPFVPILPEAKNSSHHIEKNFFADGDLNILYTTLKAGNLYIQTSLYMDTDSLNILLIQLPFIIFIVSLPLLIFSFFAAQFFTARLLKPVSQISQTAKEISSQNLSRRIPENGSGDELEELARTFNDLFSRLQNDFERERRFVSDISHELKTPLAVLLGHLDLVRRWGKKDPQAGEKSIEIAYSETKNMQVLIENMLTLSKSETETHVPLAQLELKPILQRVVDSTLLINPSVEFTLLCEDGQKVLTNEDVLLQVLRIVVANSVMYSLTGAQITFEYGDLCLKVRDRGIGISEKDLPHIFERLYRADESRNRKTGGLGLGLSIARSLLKCTYATIVAVSPAKHSDGECGTEIQIRFQS